MKTKASVIATVKSVDRLLAYARGVRLPFWLGLALDASEHFVINTMFALLLKALFEQIALGRPDFGAIFAIMGAGTGTAALCIILGGWLFRRAGTRAAANLRQALTDRVLSLPSQWLDGNHSGDVLSRMTADLQAAEQALGWNLRFPAKALFSGVGSAAAMFVTDWRFALLAIALGLLCVWATSRFAAPMKRVSEAVQAGLGRVSERASDILAAATLLRIFSLGPWAAGRVQDASEEVRMASMRRTRIQTAQDAVNAIAGWLAFIGIILLGSVSVIFGLLPFASMMSLAQMNNGVNFLFLTLGGSYTALQASLAGASRVFEVLDAEPEPDAGAALQPVPGAPAIELADVGFRYEDGQEVLRGITHTVRRGETVALVGGSGGGKSTVLKLLMGLYPAGSGSVSLFGHAMNGRGTDLRQFTAYVPQTCYLFTGTVRDNILAGRPEAAGMEVEAAARAALAHEFILELPQGYDTQVGERGAQLSGGQRQRIAIARALLKDAPLLLLDEATASLDSQSETQVQQALQVLMAGRTTVVVAHRLSTVRYADRILVIEGGRIVEQGTHDELLGLGSRYASYYHAQFESGAASA